MKYLIILLAPTLLFFTACKKDSSKKDEKSVFAIDSVEYKVAYTEKITDNANVASIFFFDKQPFSADQWHWAKVEFRKVPVTSGIYKLNGGFSAKDPGKFMLTVFSNSTGEDESYTYNNAGSDIEVNVTVTKGKVILTIPRIYLKNMFHPEKSGIWFSGTLREM